MGLETGQENVAEEFWEDLRRLGNSFQVGRVHSAEAVIQIDM